MSSISPYLTRIPNMLASQTALSSITRSNAQLIQLQIQLATGLAFSRPSEDPIGASTVLVLDDLLERREQRLRNLSHAQSMLSSVDSALGGASSMLLEAKGIALSQIGVGSDAETRAAQADVIDSILQGLQGIANRDSHGIRLFGGSSHTTAPFEGMLGGIRYGGSGSGLLSDIGLGGSTPLTLAGDRAFGAVSARVEGERDLDPSLRGSTRLVDLGGARGLGVTPGSLTVVVDGVEVDVDLSDASTIEDVRAGLEAAMQTVDPGATVSLDAAAGDGFVVTPSAGVSIEIQDTGSGTVAADLGLSGTYPGGVATMGDDLQPSLTWTTPLDSLDGMTVPLGVIRVSNGNQVREVDLSGASTAQDIRNTLEQLGLGIRVEIAESGDRLSIHNEVSGASMSISEVSGGTTASDLGIRSFTESTPLSSFNDGGGVRILSGAIDPVTGLPDPAADMDVRVTLADGQTFEVDFVGAETVGDIIAAMEAAAMAAGIAVPGEFDAGLVDDGNGIAIHDFTAGAGELVVEGINNSPAAEQLGIIGSGSAMIAGEDRAKVAVDGVFAHLIALRDALRADNEFGIEVAAERLEADLVRVAESRAEVGVRARRVDDAVTRQEDLSVQDRTLKSSIQDLDFTSAALRFSAMQQQLQAAMATAGSLSNLSLIDFLR
jgi:flagellar hook-associated protein 3 FlgL